MFRVLVEEIAERYPADAPASDPVKRFEQCVDELNLRAVIQAVNLRPRKAREPKTQPAKKEAKA